MFDSRSIRALGSPCRLLLASNALLKVVDTTVHKTKRKSMRTIEPNDECTKYPKTLEKLCMFLAAEGHKLLAAEENKSENKPITKNTNSKPLEAKSANEVNPYIRARNDILNKMGAFEKKEIETMEREGNLDNRIYNNFVHQVRLIADAYYK